MRVTPWYFDPLFSTAGKNQKTTTSRQSKLGNAQAGVPTVKTSTDNANEIVDIISAMSQSETLASQLSAQSGTQKTSTQSAINQLISSIQNMLLTSKTGSSDFLEGEQSQQGSWGICYAISSLYSIAKNMVSTVLTKIKNMFSITSNGDIQVTFAKDANGNNFTAAQLKQGINKETITAADLQYLYSTGMYTRAAESAGNILAMAYGKLRLAMSGRTSITSAQAASSAAGGVPAYFMAALGAGTASYFFPGQYTDATLVQTVKAALSAKKALVGASNANGIPGLQIVGSHAYSIVGMDANNNIIIRNPWGVDGSTGNIRSDGKNDGFITLTPAQFKANFSYISTLAA